jgi:hypothetical protein
MSYNFLALEEKTFRGDDWSWKQKVLLGWTLGPGDTDQRHHFRASSNPLAPSSP